jgi:hypothetical protein
MADALTAFAILQKAIDSLVPFADTLTPFLEASAAADKQQWTVAKPSLDHAVAKIQEAIRIAGDPSLPPDLKQAYQLFATTYDHMAQLIAAIQQHNYSRVTTLSHTVIADSDKLKAISGDKFGAALTHAIDKLGSDYDAKMSDAGKP